MNIIRIQFAFKPAAAKSIVLALGCVCGAFSVPAQDKLIFAAELIRHGDRTPLGNYFRENSTNWPEGQGQLTALGTNQEYTLGSDLRKLYYRELLNSQADSNSICAFSTDTDRTRQSARLFLSGLAADRAAAIPVHLKAPIDITASWSDGNAIGTGKILFPDGASNYQALLSQYVLSSPEWAATNAALQPQFARWSQIVNHKINSVRDLIGPGDTLYIHQIHHVPLTNGLSPDDIEAIIAAGRWAFVYQFHAEVGRITGTPFLRKLAEYLENARREEISGNKTALKFVLFSAHDSTMLSEMSALRSPLTGTNSIQARS